MKFPGVPTHTVSKSTYMQFQRHVNKLVTTPEITTSISLSKPETLLILLIILNKSSGQLFQKPVSK